MDKPKLTFQSAKPQIMDMLPAVIFEYSVFPDGSRDFTYLSVRCEEVLGVSREVLLSGVFPMKQFIYADDWERFFSSSERSICSFSEWKWEGRIWHGKTVRWIEAIGIPCQHEDGRISWSGIINDISERKAQEQKQREVENSHRNLVEHLPLGVGVHKLGKLIYVNNYALRMIGARHPSEVYGRSIMDFIHPDFQAIAAERVSRVLSGETPVPEEEKFIRLDGAIIDVEVACYPVTYEGEPAVQIIVKDITEEKAAAQNSRRTQTLFSQLFQNSPVAIVMLSDRGTVVKINRGFEEMFGYSQEELLGKELNQFIVPEGLESEGNDLDTLISSYRVIRLETTRVQKGGRLLTVIIYGLPVHLDETTIGIFGLYVDITERKKVEEELKVRNTELDNFVYKVSHDLRAPLSSILGLVNLASLPGNDDNLKDYIPLVGQKVQQLDHFISDVLSHSKNLKLEVQTDLIDLHHTIHETFTGLSYLKGASEMRKKISISGSDFYSDPWRIGEIFRNLISNAIKYRKLDKTESWIEIEARCTEHAVEISIKDNGIGIPAENQGRVFEMFYRASEQSEGSGLGLYIVKNAVEKLDGVVMVDSEPRLGTTFKVVLPNRIQKGNAIP